MTAPIDEVDAPAVKVNMEARVIMDAFGDRHFPGRVRRIDPYVLDVEKQARTVDVEVDFINTNHDLVGKIAEEKDADKQKNLIKQALDLAKLQQNLLHGEDLTQFVKRSFSLLD